MNLIKKAQATNEAVALIVESIIKYEVPISLMESLDGLLHSYIQRINSGEMQRFGYDDLYALSNIFAFASLMGVIQPDDRDPSATNAILNLYRRANKNDPSSVVTAVERIVDRLGHTDPNLAAKFKGLANVWGRSLSQTAQSSNPSTMKVLSGRLLATVERMRKAVAQIEASHGDSIARHRVSQSQDARSLGLKPTPNY